MHFDGACSSEGNGFVVVVYSPVGKINNFSYRLKFACTNNVKKFESLVLGIESWLLSYFCFYEFLTYCQYG
jgi:hypothetical protein